MSGVNISRSVDGGGASQKIILSAASAQSGILKQSGFTSSGNSDGLPFNILFTCDVTCYVRQGLNPVAVSDGTDQIFLAGTHRIVGIATGNKLGIIAAGAGNAYITPEV